MRLAGQAGGTHYARVARRVSTSRGRAVLPLALFALLAGVLTLLPGCTRRFYRIDADREVAGILEEKDNFAEWELRDYNVYPSPIARYFDPSDPDKPPMPPDDPAAWLLSPHPQKPKRIAWFEGTGYLQLLEQWDAENRARRQEAQPEPEAIPTPPAPVPGTPGPPPAYLINLEQAVELAVLNSREYQNQRENLYLTALPVTLERFAFAPQFDAALDAVRNAAGSQAGFGSTNEWDLTSTVGMHKQFYTGALLLVQLANQTVVNLTGPGRHTISESNLIVDLSQPFLRGGGRPVVMEDLTQSERDLLYALRDYAHFHSQFFVSITAGGGGLTAGGGDFGGVELTVQGQASSVGYLPTLQRRADVINQERSLEKLRTLRVQYRKLAQDPLPRGGQGIRPLQADQVEQSFRQTESTLLNNRVRYADALDQLKIQLGLPTDLPLDVDASLLDGLYRQIDNYEGVLNTTRDLIKRINKLQTEDFPPQGAREELRRFFRSSAVFAEALARWEKNRTAYSLQIIKDVGPDAPERKRLQDTYDALQEQEPDRPIPSELEDQLNGLKLEERLAKLELALREYEREPWRTQPQPDAAQKLRRDVFELLLRALADVITQVKRGRLDVLGRASSWPELLPVRLSGVDIVNRFQTPSADYMEEARNLVGRTALVNRLDLMNQRAQVVDSWRNLAVFANSLLGTFDVRYHMDVATPAGLAQPLDFEAKRSRHQLFVNTELPLVRVQQRNNYRASLIAYQRQRRNLMATEDQTLFQVRQLYRQLQQQALDYRLQQLSLDLTYRTLDNSLESVEQAVGDPAALTNDLLRAVQSVPRDQSAVINSWITYNQARMRLYRDLELLRVDSRGVWIDEFATPQADGNAQPLQPQP